MSRASFEATGCGLVRSPTMCKRSILASEILCFCICASDPKFRLSRTNGRSDIDGNCYTDSNLRFLRPLSSSMEKKSNNDFKKRLIRKFYTK